MEILDQAIRFAAMAGPFIFLQLLLLLVVLLLTLINVLRLLGVGLGDAGRLARSVNAILFWGAVTAVIGFMATWSGLLKAFRVLAQHGLAKPQAIYMGLSEAHITTAVGLGVLLLAGFLWFGLKAWIERRDAVVL